MAFRTLADHTQAECILIEKIKEFFQLAGDDDSLMNELLVEFGGHEVDGRIFAAQGHITKE